MNIIVKFPTFAPGIPELSPQRYAHPPRPRPRPQHPRQTLPRRHPPRIRLHNCCKIIGKISTFALQSARDVYYRFTLHYKKENLVVERNLGDFLFLIQTINKHIMYNFGKNMQKRKNPTSQGTARH